MQREWMLESPSGREGSEGSGHPLPEREGGGRKWDPDPSCTFPPQPGGCQLTFKRGLPGTYGGCPAKRGVYVQLTKMSRPGAFLTTLRVQPPHGKKGGWLGRKLLIGTLPPPIEEGSYTTRIQITIKDDLEVGMNSMRKVRNTTIKLGLGFGVKLEARPWSSPSTIATSPKIQAKSCRNQLEPRCVWRS